MVNIFADVDYKVCLNTEFVRKGLINLDKSGNIKEWKAYSNYCDGSVQIRVKDKKSTEVVNAIIYELQNLKPCPIKKGFSVSQINLVDEGPTMAKILGLNMENVDGRVIEEIFT